MRWAPAIAAAGLVAVSAAAARAAEVPIPPAPTAWVTDQAGFISAGERESLDVRLARYAAQTGHQVVVWIGSTTGDAPLEDWTVRAFAAWKVGRKGMDDGAALFVFTADRKVRIEVGYGLEGALTDARSSEIIRNIIVPGIRSGDRDGAIDGGVSAMLAAIGGGSDAAEPTGLGGNADIGLIVAILGIIFFLLMLRSPGLAGWMLYTIASGRGFGGGGFGGGGFGGFSGGGGFGGFSGGGGMSGGGGASGSW